MRIFLSCFWLVSSFICLRSYADEKPSYQIEVVPVQTSTRFNVDSVVEIEWNKKGMSNWKLSGTCEAGLQFEILPGITPECTEGKWSSQLAPKLANDILLVKVSDDKGPIETLKWLLLWRPGKADEKGFSSPKINSVTQAFLDDKPIDFVDLDSEDRTKIVLKNFSPGLEQAEKAELFFSNGTDQFQVSETLDKEAFEQIPWEKWGPKIEQPGTYQYRITLWKNQRDYLGTLNDLNVGHFSRSRWKLRDVSAGMFFGYQSSTQGSVFSVDLLWTPRFQLTERWALMGGAGFLVLKDSASGLFPAVEGHLGVGFKLAKIELQTALGWQTWWASRTLTGAMWSAAGVFELGEKTSSTLLNARAIQVRYAVVLMDPTVHLLRSAISWTL